MAGKRELVVNADEFGRSAGVNRGIIEAHERGVVTSASVLVRRPGAEEAARLARRHPSLGVGLQVDLGEWLHGADGWQQVDAPVPPDDADAVAVETMRQLERFRALFGRDPTHLDSHQSLHRAEPLRSILLTTAKELRVPLRHYTRDLFVYTDFHGQTSRGQPFLEGIAVDRLVAVIGALPPGRSEIVCHPGYADDGAGPYGVEREVELATLCDPRVAAALLAHNVELRSFHEFGAQLSIRLSAYESSFRERGRKAFERGDFRGADWWLRRAVAVDADRPWPWLWLSRAQLRNGEFDEAARSVARALELLPDWPAALLQLADLHLEVGHDDEAARIMERALHGRVLEHAEVRTIARRILRLRDPVNATRLAETLAAAHPDEETAKLARAVTLWRSGERGRATQLLRPLAGANGNAATVAGEFFLEVNEPREAWRALRGQDARTTDRRLLLRVAHALRREGELLMAWEAFDHALGMAGRDAEVRRWRDVVVGEVQVLSGSWSAPSPPLAHFRGEPGRVLHVVGRSLPWAQTGYSVRTQYLVRAQRDAGIDAAVATQFGFPWDQAAREAPLQEEVDGVPYHRLMGPDGIPRRLDDRLTRNVEELAALVRRQRPAVLHAASDFRNALLALEVGRAAGIPVVYEVRGFWEETWRSKHGADAGESTAYRWRRDRELTCMRAADRVVTLAEVMRAELVERGIPDERIVVVPNAVDTGAFVPTSRDPALARSLGIAGDEVVVGYISSLVSYEGLGTLIEAVARLAARGVPVRGLIVGDGDDRPALEAQARAAGMAERVIFTGRVPHADVLRYYGLIDIFVVPRTADRVCRLVTPLKPYEAMAAGKPVVVSGVEALREMVVPGQTGLLFRPEDPDDLAEVLGVLIASPERRAELGRNAREWVCSNRTWEQNAIRYRDMYAELGVFGPAADARHTAELPTHNVAGFIASPAQRALPVAVMSALGKESE